MISYGIDLPDESPADGIPDRLIVADGFDDLGTDPNTSLPLIGFGTTDGLGPNYLSYLTQRRDLGNEFQIDNSTPTQVALAGRRGESLQPAELQGATNVFAPTTSENPAYVSPAGNPSYFDESGTPLSTLVDKTGADTAPSGPDSITGVVPDPGFSDVVRDQSPAVTATFSMLKKYNKYTGGSQRSDEQFVDVQGDEFPTDALNFDENTRLSIQIGKGSYQIPNDAPTDVSAGVSLDRMQSVAESMLLKASGWDTGTTAGDSIDPNGTFADFSDLDPYLTGLYPDVVSTLFPDQVRPRESFGAPLTQSGASFLAGRGEVLSRTQDPSDARYSSSTTVSYNPDLTFTDSGDNSAKVGVIRRFQAAISISELATIIEGTLVSLASYFKDQTLMVQGLGPYYMGRSTRQKTEATLRALTGALLVNTGRFEYAACVKRGLQQYFGETYTNPSTVATTYSVDTYQRLAQSWGFWNSVMRSNAKIITLFEQALNQTDAHAVANTVALLLKSRALKIANVFAQIGYTSLVSTLGAEFKNSNDIDSPQSDAQREEVPFSQDSIATSPGTRVSKSRDNTGRSALSLAWRNSSLPTALLLPNSLIRASIDMDYIFEGPNAVKEMLTSTLQDKTYVTARNVGRIPIGVVHEIENRLDAEYVPFYFQDLRTNEVIAFHAFLETLSDAYNPTFNKTNTYGRADPVQNYTSTKRSIGGSFWIVATDPDDFNEMWHKINKLVTLVYPQYTEGVLNTTTQKPPFGKDQVLTFEQPFSQIVGASPIFRLRVGDVIKSNYSRFNLARLFGAGSLSTGIAPPDNPVGSGGNIGINRDAGSGIASGFESGFSTAMQAVLLAVIASPIELLPILGKNLTGPEAAAADSAAYEVLAPILTNGFVNPLVRLATSTKLSGQGSTGGSLGILDSLFGRTFLKPRHEPYEFIDNSGKTCYIKALRPLEVSAIKAVKPSDGDYDWTASKMSGRSSGSGKPIVVEVKADLTTIPTIPATLIQGDQSVATSGVCKVTLDDCLFDPDAFYGATYAALMAASVPNIIGGGGAAVLASVASTPASSAASAGGFPVDTSVLLDFVGSPMRRFTSPYSNVITAAMEGSMGRGLAGIFGSLSFNWVGSDAVPWETNWNSRAPMACKVSFQFEPIHDIAPGLDAYGANRAPVYNVGGVIAGNGDPFADGGRRSKFYYNTYGPVSFKDTFDAIGPNFAQDAARSIGQNLN